ncbi:hypothetical protein ACFL0Y_04675 [Patescibacteria group bacterium]
MVADAAFLATHPTTSLKAFRRQITVAMETEAPPPGHTFESFSDLSTAGAARAIWDAERLEREGVPLDAWSEEDQQRLQEGKLPKGYPEHPNI